MNKPSKLKFNNNLLETVVVLILVLLPSLASSQESKLGNWLIYIGNKRVATKWNIHHEVQYRNYNAIGDLEQLLLRTGLGYDLTDNSNILIGYGYINSENYTSVSEKETIQEHRIYQQFINKTKVGSVNLQHRYRFEQRFVLEDFKLRFRYFLGINVPLNFSKGTTSKFYLSGYNEIFLNSRVNVFDRNRTYLGLGNKLSKKLKMEIGYMNQFLNSGNRDQLNLLLFANF